MDSIMVAATKSFSDTSKIEQFTGSHYKRWQEKIFSILDVHNIGYVLTDPKPEKEEDLLTWEKANRICRHTILSTLSNELFDIYYPIKSASEIWESLKRKYILEDAGSQKFAIGNLFNFTMSEDKDVSSQIHAFHVLIDDLKNENIILPDAFIAGSLIEKLPESWKDYKNNLKHKRKSMSLEDVIVHIRIEEQNRAREKIEKAKEMTSKANLIEDGSSKEKHKSYKPKHRNHYKKYDKKPHFQRSQNFKKKKGSCYVCGKPGHHAAQCRFRKNNDAPAKPKANLMVGEDVIAAVVSEANIVAHTKDWVMDSGATRHICGDRNAFASYIPLPEGEEQVFMGNSKSCSVIGKGKVNLKLTSGKVLSLGDVLHVPDIRVNLISVALLGKNGVKVSFESDKVVMTKSGNFIGKGYCNQGLFVLNVLEVMNGNASSSFAYLLDSVNLWHGRLGHVNYSYIKRMKQLGLLNNMSTSYDHEKCQTCVESKLTKRSCKSIHTRETELLELIHSDLGDLKGNMTRSGKKYYITFIDDFSRYAMVYLLKSKDEAFEIFLKYKAEVENQLTRKIKRLRSDRGGEYDSTPFNDYCAQHGIIHEFTPPYSPESNGVAERKNRTLKEMMNALLLSSGAPMNLWGKALLSACFIQNRISYKKTNKTPYELWNGHLPSFKYLKVWGCLAKVLLPEPKKRKLGSKTFDCMFIGYVQNSPANKYSAAYRFLVIKSKNNIMEPNTIVETKDAEFFEHIFPMRTSLERPSRPQVVEPNLKPDDIQELRRSKRIRKETNLGDDFYTFLVDNDPQTYSEAISSPDAIFWKEAINNEIESIMSNHTWELVSLPPGAKTIGCKWIFKKKLKPDGSIEKFKARLVAKGYSQKKDIDYFDTFAPVTRITSIRVLIALASIHKLIIHQMDVKTAFLNGDLEEEIYMDQPEGCVLPGNEHKVCKLIKSLYGLKQAPKQWHDKFDKVLVSNGYQINSADKCIYSKVVNHECVIICLYVDDMLIFGTNFDIVTSTKMFLTLNFDMKDMGEADMILGIRLVKKSNSIILSQEHYVEKILKKFSHFDCKPVSTPYNANSQLKKNKGNGVLQSKYAQIIGSLMYLMNCTRPDIAYSVGRLSRYTQCPNKDHWIALQRVLRYLKGTMNYGLIYCGTPTVLEGYCDANWISDSDEMKSTSGYVFTLGGGAVSWKSSKQTCIARSTMESEFIALEKAGTEAEWLRNLLVDLPIWMRPAPSVSIHCDCQAAIAKAKNKIYNGKSRHIRLRHNIVRQLINDGVISLDYVRSELNLADPLTKPLSKKLVSNTSREMGLYPDQKLK